MGDSAGGGLTIAFCQYIATLGLAQPSHLVGISPWVDVSMTTSDYNAYQATDPMLGAPGAAAMGKAWAGELDTKNYMVSPLFGDVTCLPDTTLFTGTREILCPDIVAFYEKMRAAGMNVKLIVGEGMNHVYPVYPIPEARRALQVIAEIISI